MTFDRLAAFLQAKDVPYKVDWQDWIEEADRVLLARAAPETNQTHDVDASVGCGNCVEAHEVLSRAGIADGDLAEKIDDLVAERDAALEALQRIRDQSAQDYEDPEQEAYASRDIARKALDGAAQKANVCECTGEQRQVCVDNPDCRPSYCRVTAEVKK